MLNHIFKEREECHLYLPKFNYYRPSSLPEALMLLAEIGDKCKIMAGGTDLLVAMKQRRITPDHLIDLSCIDQLAKIEQTESGQLKIGSMATLAKVAASPLVQSISPALAQAAWEVGSPLLRNRGTVGGNILQDTRCRYYNQSASWRKGKETCLKMDGAVCHINPNKTSCLSTYAGDLAPVLLAESATLEIATSLQVDQVPLASLFTGDGKKPVQIKPQALITAIYLHPLEQGQERGGFYQKVRSRPSIDFPLVGLAVVWASTRTAGQTKVEAKAAVTGLSSQPQLAAQTGLALSKARPGESQLAELQEILRSEVKVIDTGSCPAWYRKQMLGQALADALAKVKATIQQLKSNSTDQGGAANE
jgi:4-hydroxybenzoyl-CoA reductase subunit beta